MNTLKGAGIGCSTTTILALFILTASVMAGCGGGDVGCYPGINCTPSVQIGDFRVNGNDAPVNGQEQIVAGTGNGTFKMSFSVDQNYSDEARIWVSNKEDLGATDLEQRIIRFKCNFYPFCSFNIVMNCSYNVANQVNCVVESGLGGTTEILVENSQVNISPMINGIQSSLFMVLIVNATGIPHAQRTVPVTFRFN